MSTAVWIALLVVIIIVIVYFLSYSKKHGKLPDAPFKGAYERMKKSMERTYDSYFTSPMTLYQRTVGYEDDETAEMAHKKAEKIEKMHRRNEELGVMHAKNIPKAASNGFVLADLERYNIPLRKGETRKDRLKRVGDNYTRVLQRLRTAPTIQVMQEDTQTGEVLPAEFMLGRIEDFFHVDAATAFEDQIVRNILADLGQTRDAVRVARVANAETPPQPEGGILGILAPTATADPEPATAEDVRRRYYAPRPITNDPQSVHEHQINNSLMQIYQKLGEKNQQDGKIVSYEMDKLGLDSALSDLRKHIQEFKFDTPDQRARAVRVAGTMSQGGWLSRFNARESEILAAVWNRIQSPENEQSREGLITSLMTNLADGVEKNHAGQDYLVCSTGRVGRVLNSLTLLDSDTTIAAPAKTEEIIRNEAFAKASAIIQAELKRAREDDPETAGVYEGTLADPAPAARAKAEQFEATLKEKIATALTADYADKMEKERLDNIVSDAQAGV